MPLPAPGRRCQAAMCAVLAAGKPKVRSTLERGGGQTPSSSEKLGVFASTRPLPAVLQSGSFPPADHR